MRKLTTNDFIAQAIEAHGDYYDYRFVNYTTSRTPVTIICPIHGEFSQIPKSHRLGYGCAECGILKATAKKMGKIESFIEHARTIHGDIFNYDKVVYQGYKKKVIIICPVHGEFKQTPASHLQGNGCAQCSNRKELTTTEFKRRAKEVHGDTYDYFNSIYSGIDVPLEIICQEHGSFHQTPYNHVNLKCGCPVCRYTTIGTKLSKGCEKFISDANKTHENRYSYDKVEYINGRTNVLIDCKKHGTFKQMPNNHIRGAGCPTCLSASNASSLENEVKHFVLSIYKDTLISNDRKTIRPQELDILLPDINLAIEFNGLYWHSSAVKDDSMYHFSKTNSTNAAGIKLVSIYEDEWVSKNTVVENVLRRYIERTVYDQKQIRVIKNDILYDEYLLNQNLTKTSNSEIKILTESGGVIIGCMGVTNIKKDEYIIDNLVCGCDSIFDVLLNFIVQHTGLAKIEYINNRRFPPAFDITRNGFVLKETLLPDFQYVVSANRVSTIPSKKDNPDKIWNSGYDKYVFNSKDGK